MELTAAIESVWFMHSITKSKFMPYDWINPADTLTGKGDLSDMLAAAVMCIESVQQLSNKSLHTHLSQLEGRTAQLKWCDEYLFITADMLNCNRKEIKLVHFAH